MKIRFIVESPVPLSFIAELETDEDAWRLLGYLGDKGWPVRHFVIGSAYTGEKNE